MLKTPILFLIFRRPDVTVKVFAEICKQQPTQLFIAADGGRTPEEHLKCELTRQAVLEMIDWECEVKTLFRDNNLGCREAVSSAISWFFEYVEMGIILEEDCLPHQDFFPYCEELLERYKDDTRIMTISGDNFQDGIVRGDADYYFSTIMHCWGWATWKRSWDLYRKNLEGYNIFKANKVLEAYYNDEKIVSFWADNFELVLNNKIDTWDYAIVYTLFCNNALSITPQRNLVSNIGFGEESTHCKNANSVNANILTADLVLKTHPNFIYPDMEADVYTHYNYMGVGKPSNAKLPFS